MRRNNNRSQNNNNGKMRNGGGRRYGHNNGGGRHSSGGGDDSNHQRIRKNAMAARERYSNMARDAQSSGDRILAEYYHQHADHYYRVIAEAEEHLRERGISFGPNGEIQRQQGEAAPADGAAQPAAEEGAALGLPASAVAAIPTQDEDYRN